MRFRILGPLEATGSDGRPCRLEPRQARVLAALLLSPNRTVTRERLVDAVWDAGAPVTAARQIQNCVSALRRQVGSEISADDIGYRMRVASEDLDSMVFARALGEARSFAARGLGAGAAQRLRQALSLWRGPALAGLTGRVFETAAARLEEERLTAIEQCLELELATGREQELIGELTELVAAHPLRETLVGQLMLALHRSGRRADALAAYHGLRARLAEQLGLDPGERLRELHTSIVRDEVPVGTAAPPAGVPVPRQLPAPVRHFVGRAAQLKELSELIGAVGETMVVTAIDGPAGVGKTTLVVHWAHRTAERFPDGQLYADLRGYDPGPPAEPTVVLREFLDALGVPARDVPADLDGQITMYRSTLAGRRLLVVLDNARDARQVRPLLPGTAGCLAVVTSRDPLLGLVAANDAVPLSLEAMSTSEAYELLSRRLGADRVAAEPEAVTDIIARCARLPLALAIAAARAAGRPGLTLAALAAELGDSKDRLEALRTDDPATDLRAVFSWSYRSLERAAARMFRLLAAHPAPDIGVAAAGGLAGVPVGEARLLLAQLVRAQLAAEPAPGRFAVHDLLRAYGGTLADEAEANAAVRRVLDHYLHTAHAAALLISPGRTPLPLAAASAGSAPEPLADDRQALTWFGAEQHALVSAIERVDWETYPHHVLDLVWCVTTFLHRQGRWHDLARVQRIALAVAMRIGDRVRQAYAHRTLGFTHGSLGMGESSRSHLERALALYAELGDDEGAAKTHHALAMECERGGDLSGALAHALASQALHRSGGSRRGQADALNLIGWYHTRLGQPEEAIGPCREAIALHRDRADHAGEAAAWDTLGHAYHLMGEHRAAIECFRSALPLEQAGGEVYGRARTLDMLGEALLAAGDPAAARASWREALTVLDSVQHPDSDWLRTKLTRSTRSQ